MLLTEAKKAIQRVTGMGFPQESTRAIADQGQTQHQSLRRGRRCGKKKAAGC